MVRTRSIVLGAVIGFLAVIGLTATRVQAASYAVSITATQFIPATLQAAVGDQITFTNSTTATQSAATTDPDGFNTGNIGPGQNKTVTLSTPGTFAYSSAFNPALSGTVIVSGTSTSITEDTGTGGTTTTVTTTQEQPVSGTFEVVLAMVAGGFGLLGFGWYSSRRSAVAVENPVTALPLISSSAEASRDADQRS